MTRRCCILIPKNSEFNRLLDSNSNKSYEYQKIGQEMLILGARAYLWLHEILKELGGKDFVVIFALFCDISKLMVAPKPLKLRFLCLQTIFHHAWYPIGKSRSDLKSLVTHRVLFNKIPLILYDHSNSSFLYFYLQFILILVPPVRTT